MKAKDRVQRLEDRLMEDEGIFTNEEAVLLLRNMPAELREGILEKIRTGDYHREQPRLKSIKEKRAEMEMVLVYVKPEVAEKVRKQVEAREFRAA